MRRLKWAIVLLIVLAFGCGKQKGAPGSAESDNAAGVHQSEIVEEPAAAEAAKDDFVYQLVSEKAAYDEGEPIRLYAELEYVGAAAEATIYHAASPFYFPMRERTRDFEINYGMNQPLLTTVLKKGEPQRERYKGSGGYSEQDPAEYVEFIKQIGEGSFPAGDYEVNGSAEFYTEPPGEASDAVSNKLQAQVVFRVGKP